MYKKTITFEDYEGITRTENHYFNLTKTELVKMQASVTGGFDKKIERIMTELNGAEIIETVDDLIKRSYGVKTLDGKGFDKSPKHYEAFIQSPAYDVMFMEFVTDANKLAEFVNGIIPADLAKQIAEQNVTPNVAALN